MPWPKLRPTWPKLSLTWIIATFSAIAALAIGVVQFRQGIIPLLDTVTYWSGAEAVARGDLFSTTLAPSFSNFSAVDFLERGGSLPFVDFPIGYPLLAGILGSVMEVRTAMQILVLVALMAVAVGVAIGYRRETSLFSAIALGGVGVLVIMSPAMRLVTQGALSEPLFAAAVLWLVICLARYRQGGSWTTVALLSVTASLLRFLGAPLAVLAGWERYRRTGQKFRSAVWTAALMAPAASNIVLASQAGGGHSAGWRGIDRLDVETLVRSIGGWFDARQGDIRRTYFSTDGPSWWAWPLTVVWIALIVIALLRVFSAALPENTRISQRTSWARRTHLPAVSELALSAAGIMTTGLLAGILGFDALVIADNRLMLPSGILTLSAGIWWVASRPTSTAMTSRRDITVVSLSILVWTLGAIRPWQVTEMFSDQQGDTPLVRKVSEIYTGGANDIAVVISNDADAVHWGTGAPTAYAPMPVKPLSGERVDEVPLYRALPCALQRSRGVVVISIEATFSSANLQLLEEEVNRGTLAAQGDESTIVFRPTSAACTSLTD